MRFFLSRRVRFRLALCLVSWGCVIGSIIVQRRLVAVARDLRSEVETELAKCRKAVEDLRFVQSVPVDPASGAPSVPVPTRKPRILGSGRSGRMVYLDVRYPHGGVARHYCPTNATPGQKRSFVQGLADVEYYDDLLSPPVEM